jgi:hypothetical protein
MSAFSFLSETVSMLKPDDYMAHAKQNLNVIVAFSVLLPS